ncbi:nuclear RNA export factor 1 [Galendromus occidentalis]|uniref:Nuclear RNA export factor 1 n=1 Tax=Galendromus occidentalis TaxID=34638 RepID=A0AAJ6VZH3_9ACAR|nr:nuclear RNA export factor 1 [Galendromus occidentalis]
MKKFNQKKKFQKPPRRQLDEDGDTDMDGSSMAKGRQLSRNRMMTTNMKPPWKRDLTFTRKMDPSRIVLQSLWYRILIPGGRRFGQDFVVRELTSRCKCPLKMFNFHLDANCAIFFVREHRTAQELKKLNNTIVTPQGTKMSVIMRTSDLPQVPSITDVIENAIKQAMSNRYDTDSKQLNLSQFESDESLLSKGLYLPLCRVNVANCVVSVITDHIPEVVGIDISRNEMYNVNCLAPLAVKCKELKILKMAGNRIKHVRDLDPLKGLPLTVATFAGCPFTHHYKEVDDYVSAIRERFPRVTMLDQKELPPPIVFDIEEEKILVPRSMPSFLPDESVKPLVVGFVEQFFFCFDREDRGPLLDAYHEAALFSLSSANIANSKYSKDREKLDYNGQSRNFLRMQHDEDLKRRLLVQGRLNVIDFFKKFEKTQHDPNSFIVDLSLMMPTMMVFHVSGVFREKRPDGSFFPNLRSFQRTFVVVPQGSGLAIVNEEWFITIATDKQSRAYQEPSPSRPPSPAIAGTSTMTDMTSREEVLASFMAATKMNRQFAVDCLEQNNWNPESAYAVFWQLSQSKKLPPEAFV